MTGTSVRRGPWREREGVFLDNGTIEAVVLPGGGHLASVTLKAGRGAGVNPLWSVPWTSMEPRAFDPKAHDDAYGGPPEGRLLASIMGHNLCLDYFGGPSPEARAAGLGVHGEAPVATWDVAETPGGVRAAAELPVAGLRVVRLYTMAPGQASLRVETAVHNLRPAPREIGWQEHASFGAPFVEPGVTVFDADATRGRTNPERFANHHYLKTNTDFTWPDGPGIDGHAVDLRVPPAAIPYGEFTTQLMDPAQAEVGFTAVNPKLGLRCRYRWPRKSYPWLGMWDEARDRHQLPWAAKTVVRGMEFGVWPFTLGLEAMRKLNPLFGEPTFVTVPGHGTRQASFTVSLESA